MSITPVVPVVGIDAAQALHRLAQPMIAGASFLETLLAGDAQGKVTTATDVQPDNTSEFIFHLPTGPLPELKAAAPRPADATITRPELLEQVARFRNLLQQKLSAEGLDSSGPLRVRSDIFGGIDSVDTHRQSSEVENLFATDVSLREAWRNLIVAFQTVHATNQEPRLGIPPHSSPIPNAFNGTERSEFSSIVEVEMDRETVRVTVSG